MDNLSPSLRRLALAALTASSAQVTNATTNIDWSFTIPANTLEVGSAYRLTALLAFVHTAAATPTITLALVINAVEVATCVITPPSVALTYGVRAEALFTCRSIGAAGSVNWWIEGAIGRATAAAAADAYAAAPQDGATTAIDTTLARTVALRARMTTAVAANSLRENQAFVERLR